MASLRIVVWNIGEGIAGGDQSAALNGLAAALRGVRPDLVLLNEAMIWNSWTWNGVNQVEWLRQALGLPFSMHTRTATVFLKGEKVAAVLSRFALTRVQRLQHSAYWDGGGYATLHASFEFEGLRHHVFSARFSGYDHAENARSHEEVGTAINTLPQNEAVIIGGDFNTGLERWDSQGQPTRNHIPLGYGKFIVDTRLRHVLGGVGWEAPSPDDHLLFRGPYEVATADRRMPIQPPPTDHPWVFAELRTPPPPATPSAPGVVASAWPLKAPWISLLLN